MGNAQILQLSRNTGLAIAMMGISGNERNTRGLRGCDLMISESKSSVAVGLLPHLLLITTPQAQVFLV